MEEHAFPYFKNFQFNEFRTKRLWTEALDNLIKKHMYVLKDIYNKYSGRDCLPNEDPYMNMNEFIELITNTKVIDDNFGAREIGIIYNISMMTQMDEINKERHVKMSFPEYVEAICRIADRVITNVNNFSLNGLP
jgi:hypothetical protein